MHGNLALFAFYYKPENTSGVQRAVRFAKYLPQYGWRPWVFASSAAGVDPSLERVVYLPGDAAPRPAVRRWSTCGDLLERILPYQEKLPWVAHAVDAFERIHAENPFTAILSTSPPTGSHIAAWILKRKYGIRWIADFRDPILGNPGRPRRWAQPYDRILEREIFRSADTVLAVTDTMRDLWRRDYPRWSHKFQLIWNGFDPEEGFGPIRPPDRPYRVLTHAGVLYSLRHPFGVMDSLARLVESGRIDSAQLKLRFVGIVQEMERFLASPSVSLLQARGCLEMDGKLVPRADAMNEIATADYLFVIDIVNNSNMGYTVPAKLYDYLLTGRPILAVTDPGSAVDRIIEQSGVPHACLYHTDSEKAVDDKLLAFLALSSEPVKPASWFFENFDGRLQAGAVSAMLKGDAPGH
jgi:hypothetical protein